MLTDASFAFVFHSIYDGGTLLLAYLLTTCQCAVFNPRMPLIWVVFYKSAGALDSAKNTPVKENVHVSVSCCFSSLWAQFMCKNQARRRKFYSHTHVDRADAARNASRKTKELTHGAIFVFCLTVP